MKCQMLVRMLCCLILLLSIAGCSMYQSPVIPPTGWAFSNVSAPQDADFDKSEFGSKSGSASAHCVLSLFAWGDCGAKAAAEDAGIEKINHSDYKWFNILGIYSQYTTVVYGD